MIEREPENDDDEEDDATDLVGKPCIWLWWSLFVTEEHVQKQKFIHLCLNGELEQLQKNNSPLHGSTCIELFYKYEREGILIINILIIAAWALWHDWIMITLKYVVILSFLSQ